VAILMLNVKVESNCQTHQTATNTFHAQPRCSENAENTQVSKVEFSMQATRNKQLKCFRETAQKSITRHRVSPEHSLSFCIRTMLSYHEVEASLLVGV